MPGPFGPGFQNATCLQAAQSRGSEVTEQMQCYCSLQSLSVVAPLCWLGFLHAGVDLWKRNLQLLVPFLIQPRITLYSTQIRPTSTPPEVEVRDQESPEGAPRVDSFFSAAPPYAEGATMGIACLFLSVYNGPHVGFA
jgi:hypothetical protein